MHSVKAHCAAAGGQCDEIEVSAARCLQVAFLGGPGCGRCVFDLPVSKTDPQAVGEEEVSYVCLFRRCCGK